jgi:hypothetical protein
MARSRPRNERWDEGRLSSHGIVASPSIVSSSSLINRLIYDDSPEVRPAMTDREHLRDYSWPAVRF